MDWFYHACVVSIVSRTVNMTLQATSVTPHPFLSSLSLSLSLEHPSCRTLSDSCRKSPKLVFLHQGKIQQSKTSSCLVRDLQRISPTPSVQRHCLSFLAPRRLGNTHSPSITAERRASHETNPNKPCLLDLLVSDAHRGEGNPSSHLTCIDPCWKMRCCRGAWMTLWLLAQVVPASSSLLHASATCKNACLTLSARICWPCFEKKNRHVTMWWDVSGAGAPAAPLPTRQSESTEIGASGWWLALKNAA